MVDLGKIAVAAFIDISRAVAGLRQAGLEVYQPDHITVTRGDESITVCFDTSVELTPVYMMQLSPTSRN
jgi:hypothetical protein